MNNLVYAAVIWIGNKEIVSWWWGVRDHNRDRARQTCCSKRINARSTGYSLSGKRHGLIACAVKTASGHKVDPIYSIGCDVVLTSHRNCYMQGNSISGRQSIAAAVVTRYNRACTRVGCTRNCKFSTRRAIYWKRCCRIHLPATFKTILVFTGTTKHAQSHEQHWYVTGV